MGLISSWKKSSKLRKFQKLIHPPGDDLRSTVSDMRNSIETGDDPKKRALEKYLEFCSQDEGVKSVMQMYDLSTNDLEKIYVQLSANGFGWIKGHHTALSSVAYVEPLQYYVEMERRQENRLAVLTNLRMYWETKIPQGALLKALQ